MPRKSSVQYASLHSLQVSLGENMRTQVKRWGSQADFCVAAGMSRGTLNRLFTGETVGVDVLFRVLRTLGDSYVIEQLTRAAATNPLDDIALKPVKPRTQLSNTPPLIHNQATKAAVRLANLTGLAVPKAVVPKAVVPKAVVPKEGGITDAD
jgi:transcriptional regulator with XRE-family HTH domain